MLRGPEESQDGVSQGELIKEVVPHSDSEVWPSPVGVLKAVVYLRNTGRGEVGGVEKDGFGAVAKI